MFEMKRLYLRISLQSSDVDDEQRLSVPLPRANVIFFFRSR